MISKVSKYPCIQRKRISMYPCIHDIQVSMISKYPIIQVSKKNWYPRYPCIRIHEKSGIRPSLLVFLKSWAEKIMKSCSWMIEFGELPHQIRQKIVIKSSCGTFCLRSKFAYLFLFLSRKSDWLKNLGKLRIDGKMFGTAAQKFCLGLSFIFQ